MTTLQNHPLYLKGYLIGLLTLFIKTHLRVLTLTRVNWGHTHFLKKNIGFEKYLSGTKNVSVRIQVTKFRLSNHRLMIEVGRHLGIQNEEERLCPFCPQQVENEFHFLFQCSVYKHQREYLIDTITNVYPGFTYLPNALKIESLMATMDPNLCMYIANCFDIRSLLESKPKRLN